MTITVERNMAETVAQPAGGKPDEARRLVAAAVGELDRSVARVLLGAVGALAARDERAPARAQVARLLVGRRAGEQTAVLERALGGAFGRVQAGDVSDALRRLEDLGLLERAGSGGARLAMTAVGEEVLRGRTDRHVGVLRVLFPPIMDADPAYAALRALRAALAQAEGRSPGYVLANRELRLIAQRRPATADALRLIPGMGDVKVNRYGARILETLRSVKEPDAAAGDAARWEAHGWNAQDFGLAAPRAREEAEAYGGFSDTIWVR